MPPPLFVFLKIIFVVFIYRVQIHIFFVSFDDQGCPNAHFDYSLSWSSQRQVIHTEIMVIHKRWPDPKFISIFLYFWTNIPDSHQFYMSCISINY